MCLHDLDVKPLEIGEDIYSFYDNIFRKRFLKYMDNEYVINEDRSQIFCEDERCINLTFFSSWPLVSTDQWRGDQIQNTAQDG
jgi:hypothetical protein